MKAMTRQGESRFYTSSDGLRLHLCDYDPGPTDQAPVVCLSGLTRSERDFVPLAQWLAYDAPKRRRVIAIDYRGRGLSDHDPDWRHYDLAVEWNDILAALALCKIEQAHFVGTSRGGLHLMAAAAAHRTRMRSIVFNDIGPVLEPEGLLRIKSYVGKAASPRSFDEAIARLKTGAGAHFDGLSDEEWHLFATTTFGTDENNLGLRYDPELAHILDTFNLDQPLPDIWQAYDALNGLPLLILRGEHSDLLSNEVFAMMQARWDGCETMTIAGQGHAPLLADQTTILRIADFLAKADHSNI